MRSYPLTLTNVTLFPGRVAKITRLDGTILRVAFTEEPITISAQTYTPLPGCDLSAVRHIINGDVASVQINFCHSDGGTIDTADLNNGVWDGSEVVVYAVDRSTLTSLGDPLFTGTIQVVTLDPIGSGGTFDCRGLTVEAESFIQTYQPMCRTDLFSSLCQVNPADWDHSGTVGTVIDRFNFTVDGLAIPPADGWFNGGVGMAASGFAFEIANWVQSTTKITLYLPICVRLVAGEALTLYPGCDKTAETCRTKFNNRINHQAEAHFLGINSIRGV